MGNGIVTDITTKEDVAKAKDVLRELGEDLTAASETLTEENHRQEDRAGELRDARTSVVDDRGEETHFRGKARQKHESAVAAKENADNYIHKTQEELTRLEPEYARIKNQFDLANFQKQMYMDETRRMFEKGRGELFLEQQNRDGEIWRAWLAASSRLNSAMIPDVNPTSASAALTFAAYYQPPSTPQDTSQQTHASATSAARTIEANRVNIEKRLNDPHYANEANRKTAESNQANADHATASTRLNSSESAERVALTSWEGGRVAVDRAQGEVDDAKKLYTEQADQFDVAQAHWRDKANKNG